MGFAALPKNAPDVLVKNTVYVRDPNRIYCMRAVDRQRSFRKLIRRYISQLLHGCQNPACTTPTCFSCRRRISPGPARKLTVVSARTIACYLASQDDGEQALCPHKPAVPEELVNTMVDKQELSEKTEDARTSSTAAGESGHGLRQDHESFYGKGKVKILEATSRTPTADVALVGLVKSSSTMAKLENMGFAIPVKKQSKKDPKSFTQNLFDTHPLRMLEWLPPRRMEEVYAFAPEGREHEYTNLFLRLPQKMYRSAPDEITKRQSAAGLEKKSLEPKTPQNSSVGQNPPVDEHSLSAQTKPTLPPAQRPDNETLSSSIGLPPSPKSRRRRSLGPPDGHRASQLPQVIREKLQPTGLPRPIKSPQCPPAPRRFYGQTPYDGPLKSYNVTSKKPTKHRQCSLDELAMVNLGFTTPPILDEKNSKPAADGPKDEVKVKSEHGSSDAPNFVRPPQSLSRLSCETVRALAELMEGANPVPRHEREFLKSMGKPRALQKAELHTLDHLKRPDFTVEDFFDDLVKIKRSRFTEADVFTRQSIFYVLSDPASILRSFRSECKEPESERSGSPLVRPHPLYIDSVLRLLTADHSQLVFESLWAAIEGLFTPPPELTPPRSPRLKAALSSATSNSSVFSHTSIPNVPPPKARYFSDPEAAHLVIICLHALAASLPFESPEAWFAVHKLRAQGKVAPDSNVVTPDMGPVVEMMNVIEALENEMALRLMKRLAKVVAARAYFSDVMMTKCRKGRKLKDGDFDLRSVMEIVCDHFADWQPPKQGEPYMSTWALWDLEQPIKKGLSIPAFITEWIRSALLKEWDGKEEVPRCSVVGGAITMLASLYERRDRLQLEPELFQTSFISDRIDSLETPVEWLSSTPSSKTMHLLSNPFLFPPSTLVTYLRAINFSNMSRSFETSMTMSRLLMQVAFMDPNPDAGGLLPRLQKAVSHYLVLEVRRDNLLVDALDQLWRRERRELMRPLKIRMGMDEGEEGVDHGGVQQEFFRIAMSEALSPAYGLYTTDLRTRMTWFQPATLEPLYKYELLGLLVSLAIYNGLTLPVTFPKALYRKLLGMPVADIEHIRDGWPDLAKGLSDLLTWTDGDVADVFYRTYEFGVEAFGTRLSIDMKTSVGTPWPPKTRDGGGICDALEKLDTPSPWIYGKAGTTIRNHRPSPSEYEESEMVTNANRDEYVRDYITWLTDYSVSAQFEAFSRGFFVCLDRKALSMFSPSALQMLVEGHQDIDIAELERTARYDDGYSAKHRVIQDFWAVVRQYSPEQKRQLLEFVTASDRVPVNGLGSILFVVQRSGGDSDRVPTSLTCFGRLLLPEYASRKKLAQKLKIALENGKGFGAP